MAWWTGRILPYTKGLINGLHTQSCTTEIGFSAPDCPQSFFFLIKRMAFFSHFLQGSITLKVCVKATAVSNLATQTRTCDNIGQCHKCGL